MALPFPILSFYTLNPNFLLSAAWEPEARSGRGRALFALFEIEANLLKVTIFANLFVFRPREVFHGGGVLGLVR
jgi:hypothetical protein